MKQIQEKILNVLRDYHERDVRVTMAVLRLELPEVNADDISAALKGLEEQGVIQRVSVPARLQ